MEKMLTGKELRNLGYVTTRRESRKMLKEEMKKYYGIGYKKSILSRIKDWYNGRKDEKALEAYESTWSGKDIVFRKKEDAPEGDEISEEDRIEINKLEEEVREMGFNPDDENLVSYVGNPFSKKPAEAVDSRNVNYGAKWYQKALDWVTEDMWLHADTWLNNLWEKFKRE